VASVAPVAPVAPPERDAGAAGASGSSNFGGFLNLPASSSGHEIWIDLAIICNVIIQCNTI
jgi:hypothetical protein